MGSFDSRLFLLKKILHVSGGKVAKFLKSLKETGLYKFLYSICLFTPLLGVVC